MVRAFVPAPVHPQPKQIDKLQVAGTNLPADGQSATSDSVVTIEINPRTNMTTGKACAQCGHAAQLAAHWDADIARVRVVDAGFTEFDGPTATTRARW